MLNLFHDNIKFTDDQGNNNKLSFLNGLFIRDYKKINTTVFSNDTHNDLYFHWDSFSPISWKRGTLKSLISRGYTMCSNQSLLEKRLEHSKKLFSQKEWLPLCTINQVMETVKEIVNTETIATN